MSRREVLSLLAAYNNCVEESRERVAARAQPEVEVPQPHRLVDIFRDFERQGWRNITHCKLDTVVRPEDIVLPLNANPAKRLSPPL